MPDTHEIGGVFIILDCHKAETCKLSKMCGLSIRFTKVVSAKKCSTMAYDPAVTGERRKENVICSWVLVLWLTKQVINVYI